MCNSKLGHGCSDCHASGCANLDAQPRNKMMRLHAGWKDFELPYSSLRFLGEQFTRRSSPVGFSWKPETYTSADAAFFARICNSSTPLSDVIVISKGLHDVEFQSQRRQDLNGTANFELHERLVAEDSRALFENLHSCLNNRTSTVVIWRTP